ncbi:ATP-binding cassette domain-containing protein [candidate division KSB3 bacterium]|uniref:ATP-binding cassette domain-containing protein n=1 Tax=candidate division KSB3 bacterium TaxID=2044937 RepID=A0A9D5JYU4_9BACT|nr:ATP-binding cassette domain-containing protein [candidate division KSB3 bacterium]MBD3326481.1 ATP-binding cassette domain-containing protein [candidate division KSB3 bacterium]
MAKLEVQGIHTYYGNIEALKGVSLSVEDSEIVTLIGSNGAGKSTTLNTISGLLKPRQGEVYLEGDRIDRLPAHTIVTKGISQAPEGRKIFSRLTVMENLEMGAFIRTEGPEEIKQDIDYVFELFPRLGEREWQIAGTLSGGEQQMLAIGRALMSRPHILLLDEPSMGLAPLLVDAIFTTIEEINKQQGITILLVEQNAQVALSIAHRGYVMQTGEIVLHDTAQHLQENEMVRRLYLGEEGL